MADAEDGCAVWVVLRDGTIGIDAEDFSVERRPVLRARRIERIAGTDPQMAVRSEPESATVVAVCRTDSVEHDTIECERVEPLAEDQGNNAVGWKRRNVGEHGPVFLEARRDRQPEQPSLSAEVHIRHNAQFLNTSRLGIDPQDACGLPFGNQRRAIGKKCQAPRHVQAGDDLRHLAGKKLGFLSRSGLHTEQGQGQDRQDRPRYLDRRGHLDLLPSADAGWAYWFRRAKDSA